MKPAVPTGRRHRRARCRWSSLGLIGIVVLVGGCGTGDVVDARTSSAAPEEPPVGELATAPKSMDAGPLPPFRQYVRVEPCAAFDDQRPAPYLVHDAPADAGDPTCFRGIPEGREGDDTFDTVGVLYVPPSVTTDADLFEILDAGGILVEVDPGARREPPPRAGPAADGRTYSARREVRGHDAVITRPRDDRYSIWWVEDATGISVHGNRSADELLAIARRVEGRPR